MITIESIKMHTSSRNKPCLTGGRLALAAKGLGRLKVFRVSNAFKRPVVQPPVVTPEEKTLQSIVETGIRGSIAMAAAYTLHLNLFAHMHFEPSHILTGIQAATPCLAMEAALLLISSSLPATSKTKPAAAAAAAAPADVYVAALQEAVESVYLHNMRYSLIGAAGGMRRVMLEAAAQLSDDLLARGVLLGCSSAWLAARFFEAGVCEQPLPPGATLPAASSACGLGAEWLAAAAICCMIATRYDFHSRSKTSNLQQQRQTAAAEAAMKQQLLRYEPKAVQDAAAAAAAAAAAVNDNLASNLASAEEENEQLVARLVHGWLGARFVVGQASMFAAFVATDNLLASFAAGLAMTLVANACCDHYLQHST